MKTNKNIYRALILLSFIGLNVLILYGISGVWSYLNTGADRSSMLHLNTELEAAYIPKITWQNHKNEGRPMEGQTRSEIERDYQKAWYVRNLAYANNTTEGIADYYTDSARVKLFDMIALNKANGVRVEKTTIAHHLKIDFYSEDGLLVVFTDENVSSYEEIYEDDVLISKLNDTTSYQIMMFLEDGFWRIRHQVEIPLKINTTLKEPEIDSDLEKQVSEIKGINYYPQKTPWNMFGKHFNASVISEDFKFIKKMGLNTVRVFVPYTEFGKANIDEKKLQQLKQTLDVVEVNELKVVVTLFDFYGNYEINDWTLTHRHAEYIVTAFKNHEAILAWDIKNEPDLDFESRGKEKVLAWLAQMLVNVKEWDANHLVTIGWSSPEAAIHLNDEVDFVSFHYYREPYEFSEAFAKLKRAVPNKELLLQEYGFSSYSGIWNGFTGSQEKQAQYYKEMQGVLEKEKLPFVLWSLYDFDEIPTSVVGRLPWRKARQQYFGLIAIDGKAKRAYELITIDKE